MKHIATIALATILAACGNDPVTYAGYFDDDQDKSVTTSQPNDGTQIFNNYGSGNMTVNNTIQNTVNYVAPQVISSSSVAAVAVYYQSSASTDPCKNYPWNANSIHFELINGKLFVINNTKCNIYAVRYTYRKYTQSSVKNEPVTNSTGSLGPYATSVAHYATSSTKGACIEIEAITVATYSGRDRTLVCNN